MLPKKILYLGMRNTKKTWQGHSTKRRNSAFFLFVFLGMLTAATTLAMDSVRQQAGTGSALLGACGFLFGSIVSPLVGMGNMLFTTGLVLVLCAIGSGVCALWVRQKTTAANTANVCA